MYHLIVFQYVRDISKDEAAEVWWYKFMHLILTLFQYGGDISRKMKLLKRQAEGKKKMRKFGNIDIPKDAFIKVLKRW